MRDVYGSPYYRNLSVQEKTIKYPHPIDSHIRTISEGDLQMMTRQIKEHILVCPEDVSINVIRLYRTDPPIEFSLSWTCGSSIILQSDKDLVHECCHVLQRLYPSFFHNLYIQWGFRLVQRSVYDMALSRWNGILNPDTYLFPYDYGFVDSTSSDDPTLITLCFYDWDHNTVSVDTPSNNNTFTDRAKRREVNPWILFLGDDPVEINHPHELMAQWVAQSGNYFTIITNNKMKTNQETKTLPDLQVCVCTDSRSNEKSVVITSEPTIVTPPNCVCAMTHDYPHSLFCTPLSQRRHSFYDEDIWRAILLPPLFVSSIVLFCSMLVWFCLNVFRYFRRQHNHTRLSRRKR